MKVTVKLEDLEEKEFERISAIDSMVGSFENYIKFKITSVIKAAFGTTENLTVEIEVSEEKVQNG